MSEVTTKCKTKARVVKTNWKKVQYNTWPTRRATKTWNRRNCRIVENEQKKILDGKISFKTNLIWPGNMLEDVDNNFTHIEENFN